MYETGGHGGILYYHNPTYRMEMASLCFFFVNDRLFSDVPWVIRDDTRREGGACGTVALSVNLLLLPDGGGSRGGLRNGEDQVREGLPLLLLSFLSFIRKPRASQTNPPRQHSQQPQMSLYRCVVRLRDRFGPRADTDPGARAVFAPHNAETERRDGGRATVATTSPTVASRKRLTKPRPSKTPPSSPSETNRQTTTIRTQTVSAQDKGQRQGTEVFPGFNFGLDEATTGMGSGTKSESKTPEIDTKEADSGRRGQRRNTPPSPSNLSKSSTVSSFFDSKRSEARRRKRKKSDSRPGYFDPGPFAKGTTGGDTEVDVGGDSLIMNIPS
ncbi:hypothetical protein CMUS01_00708 [Colletotrichum musicola]|uniref:Uncharacterized protein n=1 Tax=Colletotrichum musicola TaxID=2175873 RepID=A0A8H6NY97_9PEZI|nr:hypothetical protein CMUS01_00708 [Colletotrichum musicola]